MTLHRIEWGAACVAWAVLLVALVWLRWQLARDRHDEGSSTPGAPSSSGTIPSKKRY